MPKFKPGDRIVPKGDTRIFQVLKVEREYSWSGFWHGWDYDLLQPNGNPCYYGCEFVDENFKLVSYEN